MAWTHGKRKNVWHHSLEGTASKRAFLLDCDVKARIHTFMGHTRHATQGPSSDELNRHPLMAEGTDRTIVLTHNGRVDNDDELIELTGLDRVGEVDSWAIAALLAEQTALGGHVTDLLPLVEGCAALAWIDTTAPADLHLARLSDRPLCVGWTKKGDFVYASTRAALRQISRLTRVTIKRIETLPVGTYIRVRDGEVHEWMEFDVPEPAFNARQFALDFDMPSDPLSADALPLSTQRAPLHGITDMWGDDWPTGTEVLADRPRNEAGW